MTRLPSRSCLALVLLGSFALLTLAADPAKENPRQVALQKQIRELQPLIEKVRDLKFKQPVVGHVISRPKNGWDGIQGYYDSKKKALYVFDDIKGNYQKGTLVHEMVHALQDQHFNLSRQDNAPLESDAAMARAALIEGDASLVMIEVLAKEQPFITKMLDTTLEKSRNIRNAFLYGLGAKYVQALKNKGGWKAVNQRYQFPPTSTSVILHPGERITPVRLGTGRPVGEFGIIRLLRENPATQAVAVKAASGWRGDRTIREGDGKAWVVAFDKPEQAGEFYRAMISLRQAKHPVKKSLNKSAVVQEWTSGELFYGVRLNGKRVWDLSAPNETVYRDLLDRIEGPPKVTIWSADEKKTISLGELTDRLTKGDLICIGETHDSEIHHQIQLMLIKALFARDERLGVGMEMFQRIFQKAVDRYLAGHIEEAIFLEDTEYKKRWGFDWGLYRPIVEFCRRNRVPLAALNVSDELRKKISRAGYEKLTDEEKKLLGKVDFHVKEHRAYWFDQLANMHGHGEMSKEGKEKFYQVMTVWDEYMADSAALFQKERQIRRMVILAGSGHIERGFGIPHRAAKRTGGKAITVRVVVGEKLEKLQKDPAADFIIVAE